MVIIFYDLETESSILYVFDMGSCPCQGNAFPQCHYWVVSDRDRACHVERPREDPAVFQVGGLMQKMKHLQKPQGLELKQLRPKRRQPLQRSDEDIEEGVRSP